MGLNFSQTKFIRYILNIAKDHCCNTLEIICPCSKEELEKVVYFLYHGEIHCEDIFDSCNVQEDVTKTFGYPECLNLDGQITSFLDDPVVQGPLISLITEVLELMKEKNLSYARFVMLDLHERLI